MDFYTRVAYRYRR